MLQQVKDAENIFVASRNSSDEAANIVASIYAIV